MENHPIISMKDYYFFRLKFYIQSKKKERKLEKKEKKSIKIN